VADTVTGVKICTECGEAEIPKGRRLFCSERCYRRNNSRTTGQAVRDRKRRERELIETIHQAADEILTLRRRYGNRLGWRLEYHYEGYGHNDHRPYGHYTWVEEIFNRRQTGRKL
jgi:hypothetical protein